MGGVADVFGLDAQGAARNRLHAPSSAVDKCGYQALFLMLDARRSLP